MPPDQVQSGRSDPFAPRKTEEAGRPRRTRRPLRLPDTGWDSLGDIWSPAGKGSESPVDVVADAELTEAADAGAGAAVGGNGAVRVAAPEERTAGRGGGGRSDLARLARGGLLNLGGALANGVFAFLFVLLLTRGLKASRAGVFFEAIALFSIVANTAQLGGDDGLVRFIPRFRVEGRIRDLRTTLMVSLWPIVAIGSLFAVALFAFAPELSRVFVHGKGLHQDALASYIRILAPFIPVAAVEAAVFSATRGFGTMTPSVVLDNVGRSAVRLPLAALVIAAGLGSVALALSWAVPILVAVLLGLAWLGSLLRGAERAARRGRRPGAAAIQPKRPARGVASEFWRFSAPRAMAAVFGITTYWLDTLLLGALRTSKDAGIYTAASRYLFLGFFALGAIQLVIAPMISGLLTEGNRDRARTLYQTATQWLVLASWPVYLTLAVFAPFLLRVFGPGFDRGQHAMLTLSIAMLISIASGPVMVVLLMSGRSGWTLANGAVALTLNVVLNLILIPRYGMEGAALAWLASILFNNAAGILEVRYLLKLTPFGSGLATVALASTACFGVLGLFTRQVLGMSLPWFVAFGLVASALYLAILYSFRRSLHLGIFMEAVRGKNRRSAGRAERMGSPA